MQDKAFLYRFLRIFFKPVFMIGFRPQIVGKENIPTNGGVVIAGNHKHALDPILVDVCTKRVVKTLAKKDLHDGPFGTLFRGVGTIPVDLHSSRNHDALEAAVDALNNGSAVNVSPEAKRNYTDELLLPFKYGAVAMAERTGSPIVPYAVTGSYKLFSNDLKIVFGEPFYVNGDLTEANEKLYKKIGKLLCTSMKAEELSKKKFTTFKEWENEQKKTS